MRRLDDEAAWSPVGRVSEFHNDRTKVRLVPQSQWDETVDQLRNGLVTGVDPNGVALEAETATRVGAVDLVTVVEVASGDADTQAIGYSALCDLLATRLEQGADQVLGCLIVNGDPDPDALAVGLDGMLRTNGTFTPVLPLSVVQASDLVASGVVLLDVVDPATALLEIAASRSPLTKHVAMTALEEIDELVARHTR